MDARAQITVYCYDDQGNYTHEETADENPKEPGNYLLPPNCSTDKPTQLPARWTGKNWIYDNTALSYKLRTIRGKLLAATDFFLMPDYPLDGRKREELEQYRQQLRDLTKQDGFPENTVLPECPTFVQSHFLFTKNITRYEQSTV